MSAQPFAEPAKGRHWWSIPAATCVIKAEECRSSRKMLDILFNENIDSLNKIQRAPVAKSAGHPIAFQEGRCPWLR